MTEAQVKIAQISDIHIRNLKFHSEYRNVFDDFYRKLDELKPDIIINTGDTAHTKTNISPEFVEMTSQFFTETAKRAPLITVLGNHDLNLMNEDRQDAITPIVEALENPGIILWKKSGMFHVSTNLQIDDRYRFYNFGISDVNNWPRPPYDPHFINIGLFHGAIRNSLTDSLFRMTQVEYDQGIFDGLDFVMMGDIHKRQSFNDGRIWYAGSMIQQNFGEDPEKGFIVWNIRSKNDWDVEFHELRGNRRFYTVKINDDLTIPNISIDKDSRVRLIPPRSLTLVEQRAIEKIAKRKFEPYDIITLGVADISQQMANIDVTAEKIENIRRLDVQERLIRDFFKNENISIKVLERILDLNRKYQVAIEQKDDVTRGVKWKILKMGWSNLYNYGEGNVIDFSQIKGLTGIFAPNASGKSGVIDVATIGMFDCNTKEVAKNVHLINDNKDAAVAVIELMANGERFVITRSINRIKYGQKNGNEKEWGKTSLDFVRYDNSGGVESLVGELRPQTDAAIRRRFGSFDDFMLTSLFAQWDPLDIINVKETERKRILFRFLDLDIFEEKGKLAKLESKSWMQQLEELDENDFEKARDDLVKHIVELKRNIDDAENFLNDYETRKLGVQEKIEKLLEEKSSIPQLSWDMDDEQHCLNRSIQNIEDKQKKISKVRDEIASWEAKLSVQSEFGHTFDEKLHENGSRNYVKLQREELELGNTVGLHENRCDNLKRKTEILTKVPCGDQFTSCQFLVEAIDAKNRLPAVIFELEKIKQELQRARENTETAKELKQKYEIFLKWKNDVEFAKSNISKFILQIATLEAEIVAEISLRTQAEQRIIAIQQVAQNTIKNEHLNRQINGYRLNLSEINQEIDIHRKKIPGFNKELGLDEGKLKLVEDRLTHVQEVRDACHAYEKFMDAMGKDGIALQILTQKLPLINEEINKILNQAAEFGIKIEYDNEEQSIRLYIQYGQYKSRLLELGSGAEKFLASVAIRSALLSITNLPRSNLFIVDEGFGKLDPTNLEAVTRIFDYLKSIFDHVIVISHLDVMKDTVDNIIEIVSDDEGYAHVEIGG